MQAPRQTPTHMSPAAVSRVTIIPWITQGNNSVFGLLAILKGTVNDPTTFPAPSPIHGSYHWAFERFLSAALVPLTAAAFVTSGSNYAIMDGLLGVTLVMHSHIGVRAVVSPVP